MELNSTDIFSIEFAEKKYKSFKKKCEKNENCPFPYTCWYDKCKLNIFCSGNSNCTTDFDYISRRTLCRDINNCNPPYCRIYNGKCKRASSTECFSDSDCLSNKCENKTCVGKISTCVIGYDEKQCGLIMGEGCKSDDECFERNCKGQCRPTEISFFFFYVIIVLIAIFAIYKSKRSPKKNKKNNENESFVKI